MGRWLQNRRGTGSLQKSTCLNYDLLPAVVIFKANLIIFNPNLICCDDVDHPRLHLLKSPLQLQNVLSVSMLHLLKKRNGPLNRGPQIRKPMPSLQI